MSAKLTHFRIESLYGTRTIDVRIDDNKLVLVGENGAGKSTVANLLYCFLTRQWNRVLRYDFETISGAIDDQVLTVSRAEIMQSRESLAGLRVAVPTRAWRELSNYLLQHEPAEVLANDAYLIQVAHDFEMPPSALRRTLQRLNEEYAEHQGAESPLMSGNLRAVNSALESLVTDQVLFLPTYRRIEQELSFILPDVAVEIRPRLEKMSRAGGSSSYVELVEFGMQDVDNIIDRRMTELKESLRRDLDNLTATYLRDVIRGAYKDADALKISEQEPATIDAVLNRVGKEILSEAEEASLRAMIKQLQLGSALKEQDKVVIHFLVRLVELYRAQQENEREVRELVSVCNQYLTGKEVVYDNLKFEISVIQRNEMQHATAPEPRRIGMKALSSGEKQIVSLFSHVYLSRNSSYFVIIDEPELSLSVLWQRRFLPDILATGRCNGLVATTHSPFIFENELDSFTHAMEEFVER